MNEAVVAVESDVLESLIAAVNMALAAGAWVQVVHLTAELYTQAVLLGETGLADLVQDLHWIANDALVRPLAVERLVAP